MTTVGDLLASSQPQPRTEGGTTVIQPISAVPSAVLDAEARKKRYNDLRKRMGKSRLEVNGKSGRHYLWAHRADSNELDRLDLIGFTIVREPNAKDVLTGKATPQIRAGGLREDGTYIQGDVILVDCSDEVYEFLMLETEEKSNSLQSSAKDNFVFEAEKQGVPTFEVDKSKVRR